MGMFSTKFSFTVSDARTGAPVEWKLVVRERMRAEAQDFSFSRNGVSVHEERRPYGPAPLATVRTFRLDEDDLDFEFGAVSLSAYGLIVRRNGDIIWRSHDRPFRTPGKLDRGLEKLDAKTAQWEAQAGQEPTEEQRAFAARQKALRPSLYVDITFGILFFFVAREFGLVTAALTGAGATLLLFVINPFVKWDLLGGFAAFGAGMALISAGIAWGFQDDLAIKLRGTFMAMIGATLALLDAFVLNGNYLGKRMAMYMEGLGKLNPRRASLALAGATVLIMAIDTPLAFILTTDQWIWYNAFLDSLIAIPIIIGAMLFAREKDPS